MIEDTIFRSNAICLDKFQIKKLYHSGPDLKFVATDGRVNFYKKQRVSCKICVEMFGSKIRSCKFLDKFHVCPGLHLLLKIVKEWKTFGLFPVKSWG